MTCAYVHLCVAVSVGREKVHVAGVSNLSFSMLILYFMLDAWGALLWSTGALKVR